MSARRNIAQSSTTMSCMYKQALPKSTMNAASPSQTVCHTQACCSCWPARKAITLSMQADQVVKQPTTACAFASCTHKALASCHQGAPSNQHGSTSGPCPNGTRLHSQQTQLHKLSAVQQCLGAPSSHAHVQTTPNQLQRCRNAPPKPQNFASHSQPQLGQHVCMLET